MLLWLGFGFVGGLSWLRCIWCWFSGVGDFLFAVGFRYGCLCEFGGVCLCGFMVGAW